MADQLGSLSNIKTRLTITDATDDALLGSLLDSVSAYVQDRCHRRLLPDNGATYIVDTGAGSAISVPRGIRTVTTLEVAATDQPDTGGTYTAVVAADILLRPSSLFRRTGWPPDTILIRGAGARLRQALNGARIVGDFDFATTPLPIANVVEDAVVVAFAARQGGASDAIGAERNAIPSWDDHFSEDSAQGRTLTRYTIGTKIGMA